MKIDTEKGKRQLVPEIKKRSASQRKSKPKPWSAAEMKVPLEYGGTIESARR
jgi:hypothetical protein